MMSRSLPRCLWTCRLALLFSLAVTSCSSREGEGDQPPPAGSNPLGAGSRLRDLQTPANAGKDVFATAATILAVDLFDETGDGKSRGTIYVQDFGSQEPLSGISLFDATLVPASLRVAPGDVVDLRGEYAEVTQLGTFKFPQGFLPQLVKPITVFRFEAAPAVPREIDLADLEDFNVGRKWIGMLVSVRDVFAASAVIDEPSGRASVTLAKKLPGAVLTTSPTITNELSPLPKGAVSNGARFDSITGIVTFFSSLHIAPRNAADLVRGG
ncbi:MAG: hypothetical protein IPG50_02040 [Myxococcales bacterium]|nr:hypothetical protein [Myxococcales bacterium]